jgi:hypothetical protein
MSINKSVLQEGFQYYTSILVAAGKAKEIIFCVDTTTDIHSASDKHLLDVRGFARQLTSNIFKEKK